MTSQDIEASVIGGLLISGFTPDASDVLATLPDEAFSIKIYQDIYAEIKRQALTKKMIDSLLVAEGVGNENFAIVMETYRACPSAANLKGYAKVLNEYYQIRQFRKILADGKRMLDESHTHEQALDAISGFVSSIMTAYKPAEEINPLHIGEIIESYTDQLEKRLTGGEESDTLKTGINELDEITGGINPEDLVIVAARPGMGKTEFALKVAEGVAGKHKISGSKKSGVLIFTMEMSASQIIERSLAGASNLPVSLLRKPSRMDDMAWGRVSSGISRLADLDVWIVDASSLNVEQIRAITERHKRKNPNLSLVLADYLGLIKRPKSERNDLAIAHISGSLKRMAKDLKTPVMCLSQLSRDVEKRPLGQRRPTNSDLRDSGSIEQDADTIIMLYRDGVYNEQSQAAKYAEIIVTKNRFGMLGTVYQEFKNGHFLDVDQVEAANACRAQQPTQRRYAKEAEF